MLFSASLSNGAGKIVQHLYSVADTEHASLVGLVSRIALRAEKKFWARSRRRRIWNWPILRAQVANIKCILLTQARLKYHGKAVSEALWLVHTIRSQPLTNLWL